MAPPYRGIGMSSTALRTFAFALIVLAVLFGVVAYYMNRQIETGPDANVSAPVPEDNSVLAVVAVRPLQPYQEITLEDVSLVPISVQPAQYYTDVGNVVGRQPVRAVPTGSPVTDEAFGRPNALAQAIPPGTQAMSLSISDVIAVGGFVQPGDFVDVLIYLRSAGDQVEASQARILLEHARVLAYQEQLINGDAKDGEGNARARRERTAVVAVPTDQTTRVMLGASLGELRLALRAPEDTAPPADADEAAAPEQVAAHSADGSEPMPEAVAPAPTQVAMNEGDQSSAPSADSTKEDTDKERVITLKELARVKEKQEEQPRTSRPRQSRPRSATIEVYEGSQSTRISRPY